MDKRRHDRVRVQFRSHFSIKGQMVAGEGELQDLSPGGCRIASAIEVSFGSELELCIFPGEEANPLVVDGASVRWARAREFGLAFIQIRPEVQRQIAQLCMRLAL